MKALEIIRNHAEENFIVLALLLLILFFGVSSENFFSVVTFTTILNQLPALTVVTVGMTLVLIVAGIDLSVGSVLGFSATVIGVAVVGWGLPLPVACLAGVLTGLVCGAINGAFVAGFRLPAFIVTLGMLGIARGLALIISNGRGIYGLPDEILFLGQARPWGVPTPVFILFGVALVSHYILAHTPFGHHTLALGDNENAARATGINVRRQRMMLYTISGFMAGIAGLIFTARVNTGDPTAGLNYELLAITAAIIGGTNLFGGRGSILGTMIGALIMGVLQNGLNLMAVQAYYQQMAIGAVLIAAVWLDQVRTRGRHMQ